MMLMLQAPVGPQGAWEDWMAIDTPEKAAHAASLVAKHPERWRIVAAH
jgi:hypothetical protein